MRVKVLFCAALLLVGSAGVLTAQGTQTGILRGTVTTPDKATLPGATVTIKSPALQGERTTVTEDDGVFLFRNLPPGVYTVTATLSGLKPVEQTATVPLGGTAELPIVMSTAAASETVQVTAEQPTALTTPTVGLNIE